MHFYRFQKGFVLIELVTTLILVGIIGAFTGFFLYSGITGFIASKRNTEVALKAQNAHDRISAELKYIDSLPSAPVLSPNLNPSITYKSKDLPGTRRIRFESATGNILLQIQTPTGTTENVLLDQIESFTLTMPEANLDYSGGNEYRAINIGFTMTGIGSLFSLTTFPRNLIPAS